MVNLQKLNTLSQKKIEKKSMDCMNVLCVHAVQHLVQVIGGILTNT